MKAQVTAKCIPQQWLNTLPFKRKSITFFLFQYNENTSGKTEKITIIDITFLKIGLFTIQDLETDGSDRAFIKPRQPNSQVKQKDSRRKKGANRLLSCLSEGSRLHYWPHYELAVRPPPYPFTLSPILQLV